MKKNLQSEAFDHVSLSPFNYEECIERLAYTVDHPDDAGLEEVVRLIGQLAVVIE